MLSFFQDVIDEIEPLAKGPIHLPPEHAQTRVFPAIIATMVLTTGIYFASGPLSCKLIPESSAKVETAGNGAVTLQPNGSNGHNENHATAPTTSSSDDAQQQQTLLLEARRRRFCYQITNMTTNLCLGILGCYFEYYVKPTNPTMKEKIQEQEDYYILSAIQIGYQLWSLIVGTLFVQERVEMIFHHLAVICVGSMSAFLTNGFRYWTPYFFGIFELSSVPLGVMNAFKDNPAWMQAYPKAFGNIRVVFAISFLTIRLFMLIPRLVYLRDCFLVPYLMGPEHFGYRVFLFMVWGSSCFLFSLQLYWGYLIIIGIVNAITKKPDKKKKKQ